jgi:hypothetical protein
MLSHAIPLQHKWVGGSARTTTAFGCVGVGRAFAHNFHRPSCMRKCVFHAGARVKLGGPVALQNTPCIEVNRPFLSQGSRTPFPFGTSECSDDHRIWMCWSCMGVHSHISPPLMHARVCVPCTSLRRSTLSTKKSTTFFFRPLNVSHGPAHVDGPTAATV